MFEVGICLRLAGLLLGSSKRFAFFAMELRGVGMYELDGCADTEFAELEQFRLKLIGFLRLPLSIKEAQLRQALKECSPGAFDNYLRRFNGVLDLKNRTDLI